MSLAIQPDPQPVTLPSPTRSLREARIAIVHYWFVKHRGGERVIEEIADMFPDADIFTLIVDVEALPASLINRPIHSSFLQRFPFTHRIHRHLIPVYPLALEQFDLRSYDLVLSSESGPAKGVLTASQTCHVCYCHSPMRYLWDFYHGYKNHSTFLTRPLFTLASHYLRLWDSASADRVDYFVANSQNVANRIRKHYRRDSTVIYPPVKVHAGYIAENPSDYYLAVGEFVDYKRIDLAVAACTQLGRRLHVVGTGEQYKKLNEVAGPSVRFLGALSDEDLWVQYAHCRALLFPGEEDFGIVPVEALSFGRPVIAYGRGGACETVKGLYAAQPHDPSLSTGVFIRQQTIDALAEAIRHFETIEHKFRPSFIKASVEHFSPAHFRNRLELFLAAKLDEFRQEHVGP